MLVIEFGSLGAKMFKYFTHKHAAESLPQFDFNQAESIKRLAIECIAVGKIGFAASGNLCR